MRLLLDVNRGQRLCAQGSYYPPIIGAYIRHDAEMVIIKLNKEP